MSGIKLPSGQEKLKRFFYDLKKDNRFLSSYIFEGESGAGKETMAKYFAAHIMCDKNPPCLNCNACRTIYAGTNPDVVTVSNEDKSEIGAAKIRELVSDAFIRPQNADKKIFIIKNAHLMNETAQNSLLKVIEEPPEYAVFILLCENRNKILPTILSRCTLVLIPPISKEELFSAFGNKNEFLASYSMGNPGRYLSLLEDNEFLSLRMEFFEKITSLIQNERASIYVLCDFFEKNKDKKDQLLEMLILFFGDVLLIKNFMSSNIINSDRKEILQKFADKTTKASLLDALECVSDIQREMGKYGAYSVYVNAMFIKLWEEING